MRAILYVLANTSYNYYSYYAMAITITTTTTTIITTIIIIIIIITITMPARPLNEPMNCRPPAAGRHRV